MINLESFFFKVLNASNCINSKALKSISLLKLQEEITKSFQMFFCVLFLDMKPTFISLTMFSLGTKDLTISYLFIASLLIIKNGTRTCPWCPVISFCNFSYNAFWQMKIRYYGQSHFHLIFRIYLKERICQNDVI